MERAEFFREVERRAGQVHSLPGSRSLFRAGDSGPLLYVRYSKVHEGRGTFYGLREQDLLALDGHEALVVFLWSSSELPLMLPWDQFSGLVRGTPIANDGQRKAQVRIALDAVSLYLPRAGTHNVDAYWGWTPLTDAISGSSTVPVLGHSAIQTLLGSIGARNGWDVWIPASDRPRLDWQVAARFQVRESLPPTHASIQGVVEEIDVIWLGKGAATLGALFEVEHSTPVYSGLLRLNDVRLAQPTAGKPTIVSSDERRDLFVRQLNRPTFVASGLSEQCGFLTYTDVFRWHQRLLSRMET